MNYKLLISHLCNLFLQAKKTLCGMLNVMSNTTKRKMVIKQFFFLFSLVFIFACGGNYNDPQTLSEFHTKFVWKPSLESKTNDSLDVYIDYSSGMYEAMYGSLQTAVNDILTIAKNEKTKFFRAGATSPYLIDIEANEHIPTTTTNYKENRSVLDEPLKRIVKGNKQGVFITDFEFVPTGQKIFEAAMPDGSRVKTWINTDAWATNFFEEWLKKGNQIDIYPCEFRKSPQQFVYVLVFTPQSLLGKDNTLINSLKQLDSRLSDSFYHFSFFSPQNAKAITQNYDANFGGLNENLASLDFLNKPERNFEYYEIPLKDIETYITNDPSAKDKRILKKLFLTGDLTQFENIEVGLKTHRITEIFNLYQESQAQAPPVYEKDPETGDSTLVSGQQMVFAYTEGEEVKGIFEAVLNKESNEIGIKIKPDFYGTENKSEIYRIDLSLQNTAFKGTPEMNKVLQWTDKQGFMVRSLYESITEAMRRVGKTAKGKPLHSYYLKLDF